MIAPSLIPRKPGERVKTDRRDARKLCDLHRAGLLTEVHPPTEQEESVRDLCRAQYAAKRDLQSARHRLSKLLLRRGRLYGAGRAWTDKHRRWLRRLRFDDAVDQAVFDNYMLDIEQIAARVDSLNAALEQVAQSETYAERVGWLRCFRGIDTVTAMTLLAEIHDFRRFEHPRQLMSYLGLTPSEHTSAGDPKRGGITKAGNNRVRRLLIEASWHYRHRPAVGVGLRKRRRGQPARVFGLADKAQHRLNRRYHRRLSAAASSRTRLCGRGRTRDRRLHLGRVAARGHRLAPGRNARRTRATDVRRHDPEDARSSYATGAQGFRTRAPGRLPGLDGTRS